MKYKLWALAFFLSLHSLQADVLYLRNGQTLSGKIVGVSQAAIIIETANGRQTLAKGAVRRIVYGATEDPAEKQKKEEERRKKLEEQRKKQEELQKELQKQREDELKRRQDELDRQRQDALNKRPQQKPDPEFDEPATVGGAIWRSAVLPGWGQYYQGRNFEGSLYLVSFLAVAGSTGYSASQYAAHRASYRNSASMLLYASPLAQDQIGAAPPYENFAIMHALQNAQGSGAAAQTWASQDRTVAYFMLNSLKNYPVESTAFLKEVFYFNLASKTLAERKAMQKTATTTNILATLALGVYAWNIADAALFHPTSSTFIGLYPAPEQAGIAIGVYF